jgi:hypothetical protein
MKHEINMRFSLVFSSKEDKSKGKNRNNEQDLSSLKSPKELSDFLKSSSSHKFKKDFLDIMNKIAAWANENHIDSSLCDRFYETYANYSGQNDDTNMNTFMLYKQGIPLLGMIVPMLENDSRPLYFRTSKIKNLLSALNVCGPGIYKHIANTYNQFISYGNLDLEIKNLCVQIAEQCVLECLQKLRTQGRHTPLGYEIHYVNAILNRAEWLDIDIIEDPYADVLSRPENIQTLNTLYEMFEAEISKYFSEQIVNSLLSNVDFSKLIDIMNGSDDPSSSKHKKVITYNNQAVEEFFQDLKTRFWESNHEENFVDALNQESIFSVDGEDTPYQPYTLKWNVNYNAFIYIYNHIVDRYIKSDGKTQAELNYLFNDVEVQATIHYMPDHSLKFSYITLPTNTQAKIYFTYCFAFIPYFVEVMSAKNQTNQERLLSFTYGLTPEQQAELITGVCEFLKSIEYTSLARKEQQIVLNSLLENTLKLHVSTHEKLEQILIAIPQELMLNTLSYLQQRISSKVFITNVEKLNSLVKYLPAEKRMEFLSRPDVACNINVIRDINELSNLLKLIPAGNRSDFLKTMLAKDFFALDKDNISSVIKFVPEDERYALLIKMDTSKLDANNFYEMINLLPEKDCLSFIKSLNYSERNKNIYINNIQKLRDILGKISAEDQTALLTLIGNDFFNQLLASPFNEKVMIFEALKPSIRLAIFKKCTRDKNNYWWISGDSLFNFIKVFEEKDWPEVLKDSTFSRFISNEEIFFLLNKLPAEYREELLSTINLVDFFVGDKFPDYVKMLSFIPPERRKKWFLASKGEKVLEKILKKEPSYLLNSINCSNNISADQIFSLVGKDIFEKTIYDPTFLRSPLRNSVYFLSRTTEEPDDFLPQLT